jgi:hypothetical protein
MPLRIDGVKATGLDGDGAVRRWRRDFEPGLAGWRAIGAERGVAPKLKRPVPLRRLLKPRRLRPAAEVRKRDVGDAEVKRSSVIQSLARTGGKQDQGKKRCEATD